MLLSSRLREVGRKLHNSRRAGPFYQQNFLLELSARQETSPSSIPPLPKLQFQVSSWQKGYDPVVYFHKCPGPLPLHALPDRVNV